MKREAYEDLVAEMGEQLAPEILLEEGGLTARARTSDGDIAHVVRDIGLRTKKIVLQKTCDEEGAQKSPRSETK